MTATTISAKLWWMVRNPSPSAFDLKWRKVCRMEKVCPGMEAGRRAGSHGCGEGRDNSLSSFNHSFLSRVNGVRCVGWDSDHETNCDELTRITDPMVSGTAPASLGAHGMYFCSQSPQGPQTYYWSLQSWCGFAGRLPRLCALPLT